MTPEDVYAACQAVAREYLCARARPDHSSPALAERLLVRRLIPLWYEAYRAGLKHHTRGYVLTVDPALLTWAHADELRALRLLGEK